ncbi:MAG: fibronectin type III domain-containing protein [Opitutaceae bacterium]
MNILRLPLFSISVFCTGLLSSLEAQTPEHLVFTYMGDPSTTLTANWQLIGEDSVEEAIVYYDTVSRHGEMDRYAEQESGAVFMIKGLKDRQIARVQLEELRPNTTYYITVGHPDGDHSEEVKVRTIPDDDTPIRFVTGGDMGVSEDTRSLLKNAATFKPRFAAVGGDIAYANGRLGSVSSWDTWLNYYTEEMVTEDGFTIPLLLAIGNHEVNGGFDKSIDEAPFFFNFFGQDTKKSYFKRQFGKNLVLLALDSGHVTSHKSQVDWIDASLKDARSVRHTSAIYHVPLYPSHRDFMGHYSDQGREHWAPIFDRHQLTVAFENHDHTFKRSHYIKDGAVVADGKGTLYLGDGCWGRDVRGIDYNRPWYLAASGSIQHFWVVDTDAKEMVYRAVDIDNEVFEVYPSSATGSSEAEEVFAAKTHLYKLDPSIVKVSELVNDGSRWKGEGITVTLENTFDTAMAVRLKFRARGIKVKVAGLPNGSIDLEPGARKELVVSLTPDSASGASLDKARFSFSVDMKLEEDDKEASRFVGTVGVPIKR